MTDLQIAKEHLSGHTICLCKEGEWMVREERGIAPMLNLLAQGVSLAGYAAADLVVGKAVALLFVKAGVHGVFAKTLSESAKRVLERFRIAYEYETLVPQIINRRGTGPCPMEQAVADTEDPETAYAILRERLSSMRGQHNA